MRKFLILLKKEIRDLLTLQIILPLLFTSLLFFFIGHVMSNEQKKIDTAVKINLIDEDNTPASTGLISILTPSKIDLTRLESLNEKDALDKTKSDNKTALFVIPSGFGQSLTTDEVKQIKIFTLVNNFSALSGKNYTNLMGSIAIANGLFSQSLLANNLAVTNPNTLLQPIIPDEFVVIGSRQANINSAAIVNFVSQQTMFIPVVLFFVIIFAAQIIATNIANEKENKTLETLLTTPVSRNAIVVSKMVAAGIIALLASIIYIVSFRSYMNGFTGNTPTFANMDATIKQLGLVLAFKDYVLLGASLFIGILVALSMSLLLGAFAQDVKSVAGLISPLMIMVTIPYFLTLFLDVNSMSTGLKILVYAIPFSHVFIAAPNLFLHNYPIVWYGILYQALWFLIFILIAVKIFSTEKILIMKLSFSKKKVS